MAREGITEEFVHHWNNLRDRTGNNPSGVVRALGKNPDLVDSLQRLHEILERIEHHRKFANIRLIGPVHPKFPEAFRDFNERWRPYAYGRHWFAFKDFVRDHSVLVQETGDCPSAFEEALDKNLDLGDLIRKLHEIQEIVTTNSRIGDLFNVYPEFSEAFRDFQERWPHAYDDYEKWQLDRASAWFDSLLLELGGIPPTAEVKETPKIKETPKDDGPKKDESHWHYFDPDRDSIGSLIERLEQFCHDEAYNFGRHDDLELEREYGKRTEGLTWLRETVGLDFDEIQARWRDFPVMFVPHHVLDKRRPYQPRELFVDLVQIRLAYIIGADLAAISLCRATTEILMQYHYPSDQKIKHHLPGLIRSVQNQPKFTFLKKFNLLDKVEQANEILHGTSLGGSTVDTLQHRNWAQGLARDWTKALHEMITNAPARNSAA